MDSSESLRLQLPGNIPDTEQQDADRSLNAVNDLLADSSSRLMLLEVIDAPETVEQLFEMPDQLEVDHKVPTKQFVLNALRRLINIPSTRDGMALSVGPNLWLAIEADDNWQYWVAEWNKLKNPVTKQAKEAKQDMSYRLFLVKISYLTRQAISLDQLDNSEDPQAIAY